MLKEKIEEKVEKKIKEKIEKLGFEIEYIEFVKEGENNILRITIDKPGESINIDECELVSREVEKDIDSLIEKEYILEVSSPGVERQLKNIRLFNKYVGYNIYIKLFKKIDEGKEITGILESVDNEKKSISIKLDSGKLLFIPLVEISNAHTVYDFSESFKGVKPVNLNKLNKFNKK